MSIESFLTLVRNKGLARTEKFSVKFLPPKAISSLEGEMLTLLCEEAAFPGKTIITRQAKIHNLNIQRPSTVDFSGESAQFSFIMDSEWKVKSFFDRWMDDIIGTSREVAPYSSIAGSVEISAIHEGPLGLLPGQDSLPANEREVDGDRLEELNTAYKETIRYKVTLEKAYPKTMNLMPMSYGSPGIHRLSIGFTFKYWTFETYNQG